MPEIDDPRAQKWLADAADSAKAAFPQPAPDRCIHDLERFMCADCNPPNVEPDQNPAPLRPGWIAARFDGRCGACFERIDEGDPIRRDDEDEIWIGECCG